MTWVLGIDPGVTGAFAVFRPDGTLHEVLDMPIIQVKVGDTMRPRVCAVGVRMLIRNTPVCSVAYLERVGPSSSAAGSFTFGRSVGVVEGVLASYGTPVVLVSPQKWQPHFGIKGKDKLMSRAMAARLFPEHKSLFARVKDDGRSDSCLIGLYGIQHA